MDGKLTLAKVKVETRLARRDECNARDECELTVTVVFASENLYL